jgi:hypothetical protein
MNRWIRLAVWLIPAAAFVHACGGNATSDSTSGNTNWLKRCDVQADCGEGLSCLCNTCQEICTSNTDCDLAGLGSRCAVQLRALSCGDASSSSEDRVCVKGCDVNADCERDDLVCQKEVCVPRVSNDTGDATADGAVPPQQNPDATPREDAADNLLDGTGGSVEAGVPGMTPREGGVPGCMPVAAPAAGPITELATGQQGAYKLALDDTHVYWTTHGLEAVMKVSKLGGAPETVATLTNNPYDIVADDNGVFWTQISGVTSLSRATGDFAAVVGGGDFSWSTLAMDGTNLYVHATTVDSIVRPAETCATTEACSSAPTTLVEQPGGSAQALVVDDTDVYWVPEQGMQIMRTSKNGGEVSEVLFTTGCPWSIALDATDIYFSNACDGTVNKVSKTGGEVTVLADCQEMPREVVVDATHVYWTDENAGTVMKVPKDGGLIVPIAVGQVQAYDLAIDATQVYWTNRSQSNGEVATAPK